ncbi:hypothetical protein BGZ74_005681 [Mortierella antarctica]|nr:hypothetical protein BGZ74_005681 [Mortierella antarctica]
MDITTLLQTGLVNIQKFICYCIFEELVVQCHPIDLNISVPVAKVLESVQWPLLEVLRLSGDNINQWIQLLIKVDAPRLKTLQICGTKSVQQGLSHKSILFIARLIGTSSLSELYFQDILLQDRRDWVLLVRKMDASMLDDFNLGEGSYQQFMATPDAVTLKNSKMTEWKLKQGSF